MNQVSSHLKFLLGILFAVFTTIVQAAWPEKPINVIVPYAAGGGVDNIARIVMPALAKEFGQSVVVTNKPGANANIGSAFVASAAPDGYTLLVGATYLAGNRAMMTDIGYDALNDFTPVSRLGESPAVLVVSSKLPIKNVQELIAYTKEHPTESSYASVGAASLNPLLFVRNTGIKAVPVLYKGGGQAMPDLISGRVTFMLTPISEVLPSIKSGNLRALALTGLHRVKQLPEIPTMDEAGIKDLTGVVWWAVFAPKNLPEKINQQLATSLDVVLHKPEVITALEALSIEAAPMSGKAFKDFYQSEIRFFADTAKEFNLKPN